jgi:hypothetical protein
MTQEEIQEILLTMESAPLANMHHARARSALMDKLAKHFAPKPEEPKPPVP